MPAYSGYSFEVCFQAFFLSKFLKSLLFRNSVFKIMHKVVKRLAALASLQHLALNNPPPAYSAQLNLLSQISNPRFLALQQTQRHQIPVLALLVVILRQINLLRQRRLVCSEVLHLVRNNQHRPQHLEEVHLAQRSLNKRNSKQGCLVEVQRLVVRHLNPHSERLVVVVRRPV